MRVRALTACLIVLGVLGEPAVAWSEDNTHRHRIGVQLGGSNFVQFVYQVRIIGPLTAEVGGFAIPYSPVMGSVGILLESGLDGPWAVYVGGGLGGLVASSEYDCDLEAHPSCSDRSDWGYLYVRMGVALHLLDGSDGESHFLALDVGFWKGMIWDRAAGDVRDRRGMSTPMAGIAWFIAF